MDIKIKKETLSQIVEAVKELPVKCSDFDAADRWVGIVMVLEALLNQPEEAKTIVAEEE